MKIIYSKQFVKHFKLLDRNLQERVKSAIDGLPDGDIKRLQGTVPLEIFRLPIGKYRMLFSMKDETISIIDIDTRGDIYKQL